MTEAWASGYPISIGCSDTATPLLAGSTWISFFIKHLFDMGCVVR